MTHLNILGSFSCEVCTSTFESMSLGGTRVSSTPRSGALVWGCWGCGLCSGKDPPLCVDGVKEFDSLSSPGLGVDAEGGNSSSRIASGRTAVRVELGCGGCSGVPVSCVEECTAEADGSDWRFVVDMESEISDLLVTPNSIAIDKGTSATNEGASVAGKGTSATGRGLHA